MDKFDWRNYRDLFDSNTEDRDIFAKNLADDISNKYTKILGSFLNSDFKDPDKTLTKVGELLSDYSKLIEEKNLKNFIDIEFIEGLHSGKDEGKIYAIQRIHSIDRDRLTDCDFSNIIYLALIFEEPVTPKTPSNTAISVRYFIKSEEYILEKLNIEGMKLNFCFDKAGKKSEIIINLDTWKMALQLSNGIGQSIQLK